MVISVGPSRIASTVDGGAQRRVDHRHGDGAVQVVAVADEDVVGLLVHLDVEVAGRAAARADLALRGQPHPHAVADARRNLHADLPAGPHPAVAAATVARVGDDLADAAADRARPRRHDLAEQRALHSLDSRRWPPQVSQVAGVDLPWVPLP